MVTDADVADWQLRLALEPHSADRRMVCVDETDTAKGDAVLSFYMRRAFTDTDCHVCLVGVRDAYGHYQNLGLRSGYNLLSMANRGRFTFVEPDDGMTANRLVECARDLLHQHEDRNVLMLVDDLGALLLLGERLEDLVGFLTYARRQSRLSLVFGCWKHRADTAARRLAAAAAYVSDVRVALAPLASGFCDSATGTMTVTTRTVGAHAASYLYKLGDRGLSLSLNPSTAQ